MAKTKGFQKQEKKSRKPRWKNNMSPQEYSAWAEEVLGKPVLICFAAYSCIDLIGEPISPEIIEEARQLVGEVKYSFLYEVAEVILFDKVHNNFLSEQAKEITLYLKGEKIYSYLELIKGMIIGSSPYVFQDEEDENYISFEKRLEVESKFYQLIEKLED